MGYYTHFTGGVSGPQELLGVFIERAEQGDEYGQYSSPLMDWYEGQFFGGDTAKWYYWRQDMENLSKQFPALLFWLEGEGEESGDIWKAWARNGKVLVKKAQIVFDEPDLDVELPAPDVAAELTLLREAKKKEIQHEIDVLNAKLADLG